MNQIMSQEIVDFPDPLMKEEIPELNQIQDLSAGIAFQTILKTSKECCAVRRRMADNLKLPWKKYLEVEAQVLKIDYERIFR